MKWGKVQAGEYVLSVGGVVVARVVKTGVAGRDDYPWDWSLEYVVPGVRTTGNADNMADAREAAEIAHKRHTAG